MTIPNLDAISIDELHEFAIKGENEIKELAILVSYAKLKRRAMIARFDGNIMLALELESYCDGLYDSIPDERKW